MSSISNNEDNIANQTFQRLDDDSEAMKQLEDDCYLRSTMIDFSSADLFDANASRESTTKLEMLNVGVIRQKTSKFATAMLSISLELQPSNTHE
ncbi:hypothetical protein G6F42_017622 [Rhizopus arrhizus]|nr:hypothetical protein G6F42_017622 [Rhizopus arrhizus]